MPERRRDMIDVAHYQGTIDFGRLPPLAGFIAKATQGTSRTDPMFYRNRDESRRVGIPRRVWYHFVTGDDAESQARFFTTVVGPLQPGEGVMLDIEPDLPRGVGNLSWRHIVDVADAITRLVHVVPFMYVGLYYPGSPPPERFPWILPHYGSPRWSSMARQPEVWQWSSTQPVTGVAGNVDMNAILDVAKFDSFLFGAAPQRVEPLPPPSSFEVEETTMRAVDVHIRTDDQGNGWTNLVESGVPVPFAALLTATVVTVPPDNFGFGYHATTPQIADHGDTGGIVVIEGWTPKADVTVRVLVA